MFELVLRAPQALVEAGVRCARSTSSARCRCRSRTPTRAASRAGAVRRARHARARRRLAALDADRAVRRRSPGHRRGHAAAGASLGRRACRCRRCSRLEDQDWVRLTQSQFAPVSITPDFWVVPSWHEPPGEAPKRDPARPRPGLRHRHSPDHADVPALDRRRTPPTGPRLAHACSTTAAARASWPSAPPCTARRTSTPWTSTRPAVQATRANAEANGVRAERRPARRAYRAATTWCWPTSWPRR